MKKASLFAILALAAPAALNASDSEYNPHTTEFTPAPILVRSVKGDVRATTAQNKSGFALREGAKIKEGTTITTGSRSEVALVFSNGSSVLLQPNSRFRIMEFKQAGGLDFDIEPYVDEPGSQGKRRHVNSMGKEPSISHTKLHLFQGVAHVRTKKLHKKSTYEFTTPLGEGSVLGTAWTQSNTIDRARRTMETRVSVAEGLVEFDPVDVNGTVNEPQRVSSDREIIVTGQFSSINDLTTALEVVSVVDVNVVVNMNVAVRNANVNLPPPPPDSTILSPTAPTGGDGGGGVFAAGGMLPGTAGVGSGGGGVISGDDDNPPPPPPTPTPAPPSS